MKKNNRKGIKPLARSNSKQPISHRWQFSWRWFLFIFSLIAAGLFLSTYWSKLNSYSVVRPQTIKPQISALKSPQTLDELLLLPSAELNRCDIALMDLICAQDLPGAENMNISECLENLDQWAAHAQSETERNLHQFRDNPAEFYNSEGYFRMLIMAVVMYEDFEIRYNPDRISLPGKIDPNDKFFANSQDIFLNGLIEGQRMGTCHSRTSW
jgi:hypothetical protein